MQLDTQTLLTVVMITYFAGALALGTLSAALTTFPRHVRMSWGIWALAMLLSGTCAILVSLRGAVPDLMSTGLANGLMIFGFGLRVVAISLLYDQRASYRWMPFVMAFGWTALYLFPWFRDHIGMRTLYINVFCIIAMALCARECWNKGKSAKISSRILICVFSMDILIRSSFIWFYLTSLYPNLKTAFQAPEFKTIIIALLFAIVFKIVGLGIAVYEQMARHYRYMTFLDPLTGFPNRRAFTQVAQSKLNLMSSQSKPYALAVFEIDHLPTICRRFGHSMGDALLKLLVHLCSKTISGKSEVGHLRDDQFALFLPEMTQTEASALAKRISRSLTQESSKASGSRLAVNASAGIFSGTTDVSIERAVEISEQGLARAKSQGGNETIAHREQGAGSLSWGPITAPFTIGQHKIA